MPRDCTRLPVIAHTNRIRSMSEPNDQSFGTVLGLTVRPSRDTALQPCGQLSITATHGIEDDHGRATKRGITLLSQTQWLATLDDLGVSVDDLPWTIRRANVLIDAPTLQTLIGQTIRIGEVLVRVIAETEPCDLMDRQYSGLKQALTPDCRGGVYGRILNDGVVHVGDAVLIEA